MAAWWPTALVVGVILYATLNSDPVGADRFPAIPHLFSAISFDRRRDGHALTAGSLVLFAAISVVTGALDEVLQQALENGRSGDILDWLADTAGIIIAYFTAPPVINHIFRNKNIR